MTSQPSDHPASVPPEPQLAPGPSDDEVPNPPGAGPARRTPRELVEPLREPAALVTLVANGLILLFGIVDLLLITEDWPDNFLTRIDSSFGAFVGLPAIALPLAAVYLTTFLQPRTRRARLVVVGALAEYAVSGLSGALCLLAGFLHGLASNGDIAGLSPARRSFETFLTEAGWLAVLAVAAFAVFQLYQGLYQDVRPAQPYPGGYPPAGFGGYQPGFPPPYGYQPAGYGQAPYGGGYGQQPGYQSTWAAPSGGPLPGGAPQPGPGQHTVPTSGFPGPRPYPAGYPRPAVAPDQAVAPGHTAGPGNVPGSGDAAGFDGDAATGNATRTVAAAGSDDAPGGDEHSPQP